MSRSISSPTETNLDPPVEYIESSCWSGLGRNITALFNLIIDGLRSLFCCCDTPVGSEDAEIKHMFSNGQAYLLDRTAHKVVTIVQDNGVIARKCIDKIHINNREVLFSGNVNVPVIFSRRTHTDHVIIEDGRKKGAYTITEVQTKGYKRNWSVDTNKEFLHQTQSGGEFIGEDQKVYLVESAIPNYKTLNSGDVVSTASGKGGLTRRLLKV